MRTKPVLLCVLAIFMMLSSVAATQEAPLQIGVAAMISPKDTFKYYRSLLFLVGSKIGRKVELVQRPTYADMDGLLENEEVQVGFICSGPYVKDKAKFDVELLVAPVSYGKPFYHAYIIAPKNSAAKGLSDLLQKKFAFTDPHSNTGYMVPTYMIAKRFGKTPEDYFSQVLFAGTHDKSIEMVATGEADGASVDSLIYDYAAATDPTYTARTKIVEKSPPFGIPPVVVTKGIDPVLKKQLREAFLSLHEDPKGREILGRIKVDRFVLPDDSNYDSVREMESWLEKFNQ